MFACQSAFLLLFSQNNDLFKRALYAQSIRLIKYCHILRVSPCSFLHNLDDFVIRIQIDGNRTLDLHVK